MQSKAWEYCKKAFEQYTGEVLFEPWGGLLHSMCSSLTGNAIVETVIRLPEYEKMCLTLIEAGSFANIFNVTERAYSPAIKGVILKFDEKVKQFWRTQPHSLVLTTEAPATGTCKLLSNAIWQNIDKDYPKLSSREEQMQIEKTLCNLNTPGI